MKAYSKIFATAALAAAIMATSTSTSSMASELPYGSAGALADNELTTQDMLTYSVQDEYTARAEYDLIIDKYGNIRPFSNIIKSEGTHVSILNTLFNSYGYTIPADDASSRLAAPASLEESYKAGVTAEIANIAMYDKFLAQPNLPADLKDAFTRLKAASENHLKAFENAVDRGTAANDQVQNRKSNTDSRGAQGASQSRQRGKYGVNVGKGMNANSYGNNKSSGATCTSK